MRLSDININAHGLAKEEIQAAIDEYIERKKCTYLPRLEQELKQIQEKIKELERELGEDFKLVK